MGSTLKRPWQLVVEEKRRLRQAAIQPYLSVTDAQLSPEEKLQHLSVSIREITDVNDIQGLLNLLSGGQLTAEELVRAYIKRAVVAHETCNCLTEIFFDDAVLRAQELDVHFKQTGKLIGPLHGIPITLKDQFDVKGYDSTLGYVGRAFSPATEDATLVTILKKLGAVILAKTNLPQSIMWCETENPLWGLTVHPFNKAFTPGGSTGGESALLAFHGSLVGFGTDIGGSIRIPSNMMGLYGLKPSSGRLPYRGVPVSTEGQEHVPSVVGPMARALSSIVDITKATLSMQPEHLDPKCNRLPWRENVYRAVQALDRKLTIGVLYDDNVVKVHPPIERALKELEEKIKQASHDIVPWNASDHAKCIDVMDRYYSADGGADVRQDMEAGGEPYIPHVQALVNKGKAISVLDYWGLNIEKRTAQEQYIDKWNTTLSSSGRPVDAILMPVMPHTAVPHRSCRWVGYTKIWNVLDYTALSFPVSKVSTDMDPLTPPEYKPRNALDEWNWNLYDGEAMNGLPVNLQLVGRRHQEEEILGIAAVVERLICH
ncbi:MAG: hypothetical protein M1834_006375 [Cirrosporium novae-zelandiae]|nr:MAG: hypothetical protein M1834_006375 [Cirrosporium novae-zelandiae]